MDNDELKQDANYELGSFHFLRLGWWVLHVIAIAAVFYLGYLFGGMLFR